PTIEHDVVIGGAGFAGLYAAKQLGRSGVDVLLLDQNNYHQFQPLLYQAATAQIAISTVARPLRGILHRQRAHVTIRTARVASVDAAAKTVTTDDGLTYRGRILVLATGSEPNFFDTPGARELAYPLYSVDDATSLSSAMLGALERAAATRDAAERQGTFAVVVVGAGPNGVETAGAIAENIKFVVSEYYSDEFAAAQCEVHLVDMVDPADIDNVWRTATGSPAGPFQVYDTVGFNVAANISRASGDPTRIKFADMLQKGIDAGKAGLGDGEGFYTYDSDGNVQEPVTSWNHT